VLPESLYWNTQSTKLESEVIFTLVIGLTFTLTITEFEQPSLLYPTTLYIVLAVGSSVSVFVLFSKFQLYFAAPVATKFTFSPSQITVLPATLTIGCIYNWRSTNSTSCNASIPNISTSSLNRKVCGFALA
jgi:hypothetical protein